MSELTEKFKEEFKDKETRHIYADDFLNTYIATQIKVLREEAGLTQAELAEKAGMKQERISVLEDVNYSSWTANVLKRLAKAFDMRLSIKIESFGSYLKEFESFNRDALVRPSFEEDSAFKEESAPIARSVSEPVATTALGTLRALPTNPIPTQIDFRFMKDISLTEGGRASRQVLDSSKALTGTIASFEPTKAQIAAGGR